jgi:hypothetical protein
MAPAEPIRQFMEVKELSLDVFFNHSSIPVEHTNFNQAQVTVTNQKYHVQIILNTFTLKMATIIHDKSSTSYVNHIYKTFILPLNKVYTVTGGISTSP